MSRKATIRNLLAIAILALAGTLSVLVARNFKGSTPQDIVKTLPRNVDLSLKEISYTETREGTRRWTLVADSADHNISSGTTRIENIRMTFYAVNGLGDLTLTARSGELNSETREVAVNGNVVVKSPKGYVLYTDWLQYSENDRIARTEAPVRLVSDRMEVTGTGMRLDVREQTVNLLSAIKARIGKGAG